MAIIRITDLTLKAIIGIHDWERVTKQTIIINATIVYNARKAIATDKIKHALDYKSITKEIIALVKDSRFQLLETLTHSILRITMSRKAVKHATVRVDKPRALRFAKSVSIELSAKR